MLGRFKVFTDVKQPMVDGFHKFCSCDDIPHLGWLFFQNEFFGANPVALVSLLHKFIR